MTLSKPAQISNGIKVAQNFLHTKIVREVSKKFPPKPMILSWQATEDCNSNCGYCPYRDGRYARNVINLEQLSKKNSGSVNVEDLYEVEASGERLLVKLKKEEVGEHAGQRQETITGTVMETMKSGREVLHKYELTTDQIKKGMKEFRDNGGVVFNINGGEPWLRKDILEILGYSHNLGLLTTVVTNFSIVKREDFEQIEKYVDKFMVSIDSYDPEIYGIVRGVPWHHDLSEKVKDLMKFVARKGSKMEVMDGVVLTKLNTSREHTTNHFDYIFNKLGMDSVLFDAMQVKPNEPHYFLRPSEDQVIEFVDTVEGEFRGKYPIRTPSSFLNHMKHRALSKRSNKVSSKNYFDGGCMPERMINMDAYGKIYGPCQMHEEKKQSDATEGLIKAYNSMKILYDKMRNCTKCQDFICISLSAKGYNNPISFMFGEMYFETQRAVDKRISYRNSLGEKFLN